MSRVYEKEGHNGEVVQLLWEAKRGGEGYVSGDVRIGSVVRSEDFIFRQRSSSKDIPEKESFSFLFY